jgi:hypothetical protein
MSGELTLEQLKARGERYTRMWETDGLKEAVVGIRAAHVAAIADLDPKDKDFAQKARIHAVAAQVVDQITQQILSVMANGQISAKEIERTARLAKMTAEQRRWF